MKECIKYLLIFVLVQMIMTVIVTVGVTAMKLHEGQQFHYVVVVLSSVLSSVVTFIVFAKKKWVELNAHYVGKKPYKSLAMVAMCALFSILPTAFCEELLPSALTKDLLTDVFEMLLRNPLGYLVIGIMAPFVEEVVFRGAILRKLLEWGNERGGDTPKIMWTAIIISAFLFSLVHANPAQMPHAFAIGLLLGWMYARTGSIIPSLIFHWINNTAAYSIVWLMPELPIDASLVEVFGGDAVAMYCAVASSTVLFCAALWYVNKVLH